MKRKRGRPSGKARSTTTEEEVKLPSISPKSDRSGCGGQTKTAPGDGGLFDRVASGTGLLAVDIGGTLPPPLPPAPLPGIPKARKTIPNVVNPDRGGQQFEDVRKLGRISRY